MIIQAMFRAAFCCGVCGVAIAGAKITERNVTKLNNLWHIGCSAVTEIGEIEIEFFNV
jgi:hypothetical protein